MKKEEKKVSKITAVVMLLLQAAMLVPAQEIKADAEAGRIRLEQYLDRASRERNAEKWERVAEEGVTAALGEWESRNMYLKERDYGEWEGEREKAEALYEGEKERGYVEWVSSRYYEEGRALEAMGVMGELREAAGKWEYTKEGGEKARTVSMGEAEEAYRQWNEESEKIIERYIDTWTEESGGAYEEIRGRLKESGLSEEEIRESVEGSAAKYREYMEREYERIGEGEGNILMGELLYDQRSIRKLSAGEAAGEVAREMAGEAKRETDGALEKIFAEFETEIERVEGEETEIEPKEWLVQFRKVFEESIGKWEEAELKFLMSRSEWEREATQIYVDSEEVWSQAYGQLRWERQKWESGILEKFSEGLRKWENSGKRLEDELKESEEELIAAVKEERDRTEKTAEVQISIYNQSREMLKSAAAGVDNWYERWGEKYRATYHYWKTEDGKRYKELFVEGSLEGVTADGGETVNKRYETEIEKMVNGGIEKTEKQIKEWKRAYLEQYIRETEKKEKEYRDRRDAAQMEMEGCKAELEIISDSNSYMEALRGREIRKQIELYEKEIQEKGVLLAASVKGVSGLKGMSIESGAEEIEEIARRAWKEAGRDILEGFDAGLWESGEEVLGGREGEKGWYNYIKEYKEQADRAIEKLYEETGIAVSGEKYVDELDTEILKAKAVLKYWSEELEVADEVNGYAQRVDSGAESAEETKREVEEAGREYERQTELYAKEVEKIEAAGEELRGKKEAGEKAEEELKKRKKAVEEARGGYAAALRALKGVETGTVKEKIVGLIERIEGNWRGEGEREAAMEAYYEAAKEYANAVRSNEIYKTEQELINGNAEEAPVSGLKEMGRRAREYAEKSVGEIKKGELEEYVYSIQSVCGESAGRLKLWVRKYEEAAGNDKEMSAAEEIIKRIFENIAGTVENEAKRREEAVRYIRSGKIEGESGNKRSEEERMRQGVREWVEAQVKGLEYWKEGGYEGEWNEVYVILKAVAEIEEGKEFDERVEELRERDDRIRGIMREENIYGSEALFEIIKQEKERLYQRERMKEERAESLRQMYGRYVREEADRENSEARKRVAELIKGRDRGESGGQKEIYEWFNKLREAGKGLHGAGEAALENYISGIVRVGAAEAVYKEKRVIEGRAEEDAEALMNIYREEIGKAGEYSSWQTCIATAAESMKILKSALYDGSEEGVKEELIGYIAELVLHELTGSDLEEGKSARLVIEVIEKRLEEKEEKDRAGSWEQGFRELNGEKQEQVAEKIRGLYYEDESGYEQYKIYIEWLHDERRYEAGELSGDIYHLRMLEHEKNEQIKRYGEAERFLGNYEEYKKIYEGIETAEAGTELYREAAREEVKRIYEEGLSEREREWYREAENEKREDTGSRWYAYYLAGEETLYIYTMSGGRGSEEEAISHLKERGHKAEAESYKRIEEAAWRYSGLADGEIKKWLEGYRGNCGEELSEREKESVCGAVMYGIPQRNIYWYKEKQQRLAWEESGEGKLSGMYLRRDAAGIYGKLQNLYEEQRLKAEQVRYEIQYQLSIKKEEEGGTLRWIEEAVKRGVKETEGIGSEEKKAVEAVLVSEREAGSGYIERLEKQAGLSAAWFMNEGNDRIYGVNAGGESGVTEKEEAMDAAAEVYRQLENTEGIENEIRYQLEILKRLGKDKGEREAEADRQKGKWGEAQREYEEEKGRWREREAELLEEYEKYNKIIEEADGVYNEVKKARLLQRKAQEKYDWSESIYLQDIGTNTSGSYKTPKEKLNETEYAHKRAQISVEVLMELNSGAEGKRDSEYEEELRAYAESRRRYYKSRVIAYEAAQALERQEAIVMEAEDAERSAQGNLVKKYEREKKETKMTEEVPQTELIRISCRETTDSETGKTVYTYEVKLAYEVVSEITGEIDVSGTVIPLYGPVTKRKTEEACDEEILERYLTEESERERQVDGERVYTGAEGDTLEWIDQMWKKGERYLDNVMLASLYVKTYSEKKKAMLEGSPDITDKGEFGTGDVPLTDTFHNVNLEWAYGNAREEVLREAYGEVMKCGGSGDIAKYILYRETALGFNPEEREQRQIEQRALEKVGRVITGKANEYQGYAAAAFATSAAIGIAAVFMPWLFIGSAAALTVGIYNQDRSNSLKELGRDVETLKRTRGENLRAEINGYKEAVTKWQKKKSELDRERKILNEMYYGKEEEPEVRKGIEYGTFKSALEKLLERSGDLVSEEERDEICSYETFLVSGAEREETAGKALLKISGYLEREKEKETAELKEKTEEQKREQRVNAEMYWAKLGEEMEAGEEEKGKLRALALKAGDLSLSAGEREAAGKAYDEMAAKVSGDTEGLKEEIKALAEGAWGEGKRNSKAHNIEMQKVEEGLLNRDTDYTKGLETYTEEAQQQYMKAVMESFDSGAQKRFEVQRAVWDIQRHDFIKQREGWKEQIKQIVEIAGEEWEKAEGKVHSGYNNWKKQYVETYEKKRTEWDSNYGKFLESKEGWITEQYVYAANAANAPLIEQSGSSAEAVIGQTLEETLGAQGLEREEMDVSAYVEELLGETNLAGILEYAGSITERGKNAADAVRRGIRQNGRGEKALSEAKEAQRGIQADMEEGAAKLAAQQANALLEKTKAQYMERLEAENRNMTEWEEKLTRDSGYDTGGGVISRNAIVDATLMAAVRERQTVYRYKDFRTGEPVTEIEPGKEGLSGLDAMSIMTAVDDAVKELESWGKAVFGETDEEGVKQWQIPRNTAEAGKVSEYGKAEEEHKEERARLKELEDKGYENLSESEREEFGRLSNEYVSVRDGELGEHIGYAPVFKSGKELDVKKSREENVERAGRGEMGMILLDFQWNSMRANMGYAELARPGYDKRLWDDRGSVIKAPSMRSVMEIALEIVGTATGQKWAGYIDDLLFAGLDVGGGYRTAEEVAGELGKKALTAVVSMGAGAAGNAAADAAGKALAGSGKMMNFAAQAGIGMVQAYVSSVSTNYIQAMDFTKIGSSGWIDLESANKSWYSAETIGAAVGGGISAGLDGINMRDGNGIKLKNDPFNIKNMGDLSGLAGGLGTNAVSFAMTGNATFNPVSIGGVGLFELTVGKDGIKGEMGMGGTNISAQRIMGALSGYREAKKVKEWKEDGVEKQGTLNSTNVLSYTDNPENQELARQIWSGEIEVEYGEMGEELGKYTQGDSSIQVSEKLLGGGLEGSAKLAAALSHEGSHYYGNRIEGEAHVQGLDTYRQINSLFKLKGDEMFSNDMIGNILDIGRWVENEGDTDYWAPEIKEDGGLGWRGDEDLNFNIADGLSITPEQMEKYLEARKTVMNLNPRDMSSLGMSKEETVMGSGSKTKEVQAYDALFLMLAGTVKNSSDVDAFYNGTEGFAESGVVAKKIMKGELSQSNINAVNAALMKIQNSGLLIQNPVKFAEGLIGEGTAAKPYLPLTGKVTLTCFQGTRFVTDIFYNQLNNRTNFPLNDFAVNDHLHTDLWSEKREVVTSVDGSIKLNYDSTWGLNGTNYGQEGKGGYLSNHLAAESIQKYIDAFSMEGSYLMQLGDGKYVLNGVKGGVNYGIMGNTGVSGNAHVDFGVYANKRPYNLSLRNDTNLLFNDVYKYTKEEKYNDIYIEADWAKKYSGLPNRKWNATSAVEQYMLNVWRKEYEPLKDLMRLSF